MEKISRRAGFFADFLWWLQGWICRKRQEEILQKLRTNNVNKLIAYQEQYKAIEIPSEKLNDNIKRAINEENKKYGEEEIKDKHTISAKITMLDEKTYEQYLKKLGLKELSENEYILINYANLLTSYQMETEVLKYTEKEEIVSPTSNYIFDNEKDEIREYKEKDKNDLINLWVDVACRRIWI